MASVVFKATDSTNGAELWVTDGTSAGTSLLMDIDPGIFGSSITGLTALGNGTDVFQANDGTNGTELWVTDGTAAGTSLVLDINTSGNSAPTGFALLGNGRALFQANDATHGTELWVTDGTTAGTSLVKDINPGSGNGGPQVLTSIGSGVIVFDATDGTNGYELWTTDGTTAGTSMLKDINPGASNSIPAGFTALGNGKTVFRANDGTHGNELWATDGTAAGTSLVKDINAGNSTSNSTPQLFVALGNGSAVFQAIEPTHGYELWVTDGSATGTSLVLDIVTGAGNSAPINFTALGNGKALFSAADSPHGRELWVTDGTALATSMVLDIYSGSSNSSPGSFAVLGNGKAIFPAIDGTHGSELWITDGTTAGTSLVKDINPGTNGSTPTGIVAIGNGKALFQANDGTTAAELWVTDGTAAGTSLLKDINVGGASTPSLFTVVTNNALCFVAGTLIATPAGQVPVETLRTGQIVLTALGAERPIAWIGQGQILATRGRRGPATPVIVKKGALADNVPSRDLHVTKGHALYLDDVLIPVEFLVNHRSIVWDDHAQEVKLYHIELDSHDVLLANGAPAESYRDDGNRWLFHNANSGWDQPEKPPYAPVLTGGAVVDAVWRRLLGRAGPRAGLPLTDDADLHLRVDGAPLAATRREGGRYVFHLPGGSADIRIISRASAPQELGLARDPRELGVAVREIFVRRCDEERAIPASDPSLTDGFHAFESDNGWRWTDGEARVPVELVRFGAGPIELTVAVASTAVYLDSGESRQVA